MRSAFGVLAGLKGLRGGALDVFGKTEERREERALIEDYLKELEQICAQLTPANHAAAVALASVPDEIRGYGHVKEKTIADAKVLRARRWEEFRNPTPQPLIETAVSTSAVNTAVRRLMRISSCR